MGCVGPKWPFRDTSLFLKNLSETHVFKWRGNGFLRDFIPFFLPIPGAFFGPFLVSLGWFSIWFSIFPPFPAFRPFPFRAGPTGSQL